MIRRIDTSDIVGISEIAEFANVTAQAVNNWQVRHEDFPKPLCTLSCGRIYYLPEVKKWLDKRKK